MSLTDLKSTLIEEIFVFLEYSEVFIQFKRVLNLKLTKSLIQVQEKYPLPKPGNFPSLNFDLKTNSFSVNPREISFT